MGQSQCPRQDGAGALSGSVEANVRKAALAKAPGTVERVETNVDFSAPYEAHIVKSDGTEVEVQVHQGLQGVAVNEMGPPPVSSRLPDARGGLAPPVKRYAPAHRSRALRAGLRGGHPRALLLAALWRDSRSP